MSDLAIAFGQAGYGLKGISRNSRAMVFSVAFPVVLLVMFNSIFASGSNATTGFHGAHIDTSAYYTAGIMAYAVMMSSYSTLAIGLTTQRESGLLKRYRGTPMPPWAFIVGQILRSAVMVAVMIAVFLAVGHFAYDVSIRAATLPGLALYLVLGTATMCTLGIALTVFTTTAESASTVAPLSAILLSFVSGVFVPVSTLPDWLETIGKIFPLAHLADGLQAAVAPSTAAPGISWVSVVVLAVWGVGGLVVASRWFRWEPQVK